MGVRVVKFEISRVLADDGRERMNHWRELSESCQRITNFFWQQWLIAHIQSGTPNKIREFLAKPQEERGKFDGWAVSAELQRSLYAQIKSAFPEINVRPMSLLLNDLVKKVKVRKAANSNLPGWWAILLNRESIPSSTRGVPVQFDRKNAEIIEPENHGGDWVLEVRLDRIETSKQAVSTLDRCLLWTRGRRMSGQLAILRRIVSGEYKFSGSNLQYDDRKRKWFAAICYQRPDKEPIKGVGTAILRPGRRCPWRLRIKGRTLWPLGDGRHVGAVRRKLLTQRWSRQANYRYAGSSTKGHGRRRANSGVEKLSQRWRHFTRQNNRELAARVVRFCQEHGIGTIIYRQPTESARDRTFLATAGKIQGREDATGWDWAQAGSMLSDKGQDGGIHVVILRTGDKLGKPKAKKGGRKK